MVSSTSFQRSILLHMYAKKCGDAELPWPIPKDATEADLTLCCLPRGKVSTEWSGMDADSGCAREVYVLCVILSGMLTTAENDSLSHRDATWATEALILLLRGKSSSSTREAYILSSYCAIAAAFSFAILCNLILGGSQMG